MTPDQEKMLNEASAKLGELSDLFYNHTHKTIDGSKDLGTGRVYTGLVNSDGTPGSPFPPGWTSSLAGGVYTVTHNLGTTNYTVTATVYYIVGSGFTKIDTLIVYDPPTSTYFKIAGQAGNSPAFYFTVVVQ